MGFDWRRQQRDLSWSTLPKSKIHKLRVDLGRTIYEVGPNACAKAGGGSTIGAVRFDEQAAASTTMPRMCVSPSTCTSKMAECGEKFRYGLAQIVH